MVLFFYTFTPLLSTLLKQETVAEWRVYWKKRGPEGPRDPGSWGQYSLRRTQVRNDCSEDTLPHRPFPGFPLRPH